MRKADFDRLVAQLQGMQPATGTEEIADDQIVSTIQQHAQPIYQIAHDRGHSAGMGKKGTEVTTLQTQLQQAQTERDTARTALEELKGKAPDNERLKAEYATQLQEAEAKFKAKESALKATLKATQRAWAKSDLVTHLVTKHNVDPDYAEVIASKDDVLDRISYNDDGQIEIAQRGKQIPFAPGEGQTHIGLLATELRETVPPKFVTTNADAGAGSENGGGSGATKGGFDYDKHAKKVADRRAQKRGQTDAPSYQERMGLQQQT